MRSLKDQQKLGKNLRQLREKRNLSQKEVANMSEISVTYYAGIERGEENPTLVVLTYICRALNVKADDILPF